MMPALPIEGYDTSREDGVTRIRPVYAASLPVEAVSVQGQGLLPQETPALPVELPVERSGGILADVDRALSGAVRAPFDALDERLFGKSGKKGTYREAIQKFFKTGPSDEVKTGVNRLLGTGGEERYKTWPEKLVVDAITAPGNVLKSETPVSTEELIKPALDVSNLAGTGGLAGAGSGGVALGSGPIRRFDFATPSGGVRTAKIGPTEITYGVAKNGNDVELTLIKTDKNARGQGHGREALQQFVDEADASGKRVLLNADPMDKGTSKSGLVDFYKSMGFVRNKGKNKDFEIRNEYLRNPILKSDNQPSVGIGAVSKSEKPFYSALERSLGSINQNKASGEQWLGMLANKGVKPDELQWSGVSEFLAGKPSVTKAELDNFLKENAFGVQEVIKGADAPTKYHDYQLPGGENYREVLMTLPDTRKAGPKTFDEWAKLNGFPDGVPARRKYQEWMEENRDIVSGNNYKSSHWDEPNILAHMRMNDRTIDGKKSLHLEEIQSDWHQAGRKRGYAANAKEKEALQLEYNSLKKQRDRMVSDKQSYSLISARSKMTPDERAAEKELTSRMVELKAKLDSRIPDAPFKKNWHELALKRAIREAVENGYERLSWTPGEAQAARYDLSKQLKELQYLKHDDGKYELAGITVKGDGFNHPEKITVDKLPDIVGKEIAEKIIKNEGKRARGHPSNGGYFEGIDLKIGGEGMKGFYDNIVPKTIEKLGKQFGVKVQTGKSGKDTIYYIDIPPAMRDKVLAEGFPLFSANVPVIDNDQTR